MRYKVNKNKLDVIDTEEKAYWIGFIWCDGYNSIRYRGVKPTYEFKLSLQESDIGHLVKFKNFMESTHPIKIYKPSSCFDNSQNEARFLLANTQFGKTLDDKYGLIPNRTDVTKLIKNIPDNLLNHFIRGILDADGSFTKYKCNDRGYIVNKYSITFTTNMYLLDFINSVLYKEGLSQTKIRKYQQRHEGRDGICRTLVYSGKPTCKNILDWLYKDATIYLDRKYDKYINMFQK